MAPTLSVVVPTYNEAANVGALLTELRRALAGVDAEFVVVDDDSRDGTADKARQAEPTARIVVRRGERGLATAVLRGLQEARGTFVAVLDADFQHPPAAVRAMLDRALATQADLVVGSRYAGGGSEGTGFGLVRRAISRGARGIAKAALPPVRRWRLTDPMSGLFLVRRDRIPTTGLEPRGYKILLEILARCDLRRVEEVGYAFSSRRGGASKLGGSVMWQYLVHVLGLGFAHPENQRLLRFLAVGASGMVLNLALLFALHGLFGIEATIAVLVAVEASILSNFLLNDAYTFADRPRGLSFGARFGMFNLVSLGALAANLLAFFILHYLLGMHYLLAEAIAIVLASGLNYTGNTRCTYGTRRLKAKEWVPIAFLLVASGGLYMSALDSVADFYFDESYYLAVAHQMDNGIIMDPCGHSAVPMRPWQADLLLQDGRTITATDGQFVQVPLDPAPLNYEHPPLAKQILYASVHAYDTYDGVFIGCRDPDQTATSSTPCFIEGNRTESVGKSCFQAWGESMRSCNAPNAGDPCGNPYAWRGPSALMGVTTVVFAALAARRMFQSNAAGAFAGSFVLLDNLILTSSRIALLDIFATGFMVVAVYFATFPTRRGVWLTTLFLGLGFACKFYVLFAGPPVLLLSLWTHHRAGVLRRRRFDLHLAAYPIVPILVYLTTYIPWFVQWTKDKGLGWTVGHFLVVQGSALKWDTTGVQTHQYLSPPSEWLAMVTPMNYIHSSTTYTAGDVTTTLHRDIMAMGNPIIWWGAAIAACASILALAFGVARRILDARAPTAAGAAPPGSAMDAVVPATPLVPPPPSASVSVSASVSAYASAAAPASASAPAQAPAAAPVAPVAPMHLTSTGLLTAGLATLLIGCLSLLSGIAAFGGMPADYVFSPSAEPALAMGFLLVAAVELGIGLVLAVAGVGPGLAGGWLDRGVRPAAALQVILSAALVLGYVALLVPSGEGLGLALGLLLVTHAVILAALGGRAFVTLPVPTQALLFGALLPLMAYLGFFALHSGGRSMFIFYMTLIVPLMAICLGGAVAHLWRSGGIPRLAAFSIFVLAVLAFLWFLPVTLYLQLPRDGFAWVDFEGSGIHYPAFGFHEIMGVIPWMHECGSKFVEVAGERVYDCSP